MLESPAAGVAVDGELAVHVDGEPGAGGDEYGIEALGLALEQPLGRLLAPAGQGLAEEIRCRCRR
jgi:hypothetical protein